MLGQQPAAIAEQLFARLAPASGGDGFTGQIDHCVHVIEVIKPVEVIQYLDIVTEQGVSTAPLPAQYHDLVIDLEMGNQLAADKAGSSGNKNLHRCMLLLPFAQL